MFFIIKISFSPQFYDLYRKEADEPPASCSGACACVSPGARTKQRKTPPSDRWRVSKPVHHPVPRTRKHHSAISFHDKLQTEKTKDNRSYSDGASPNHTPVTRTRKHHSSISFHTKLHIEKTKDDRTKTAVRYRGHKRTSQYRFTSNFIPKRQKTVALIQLLNLVVEA